jgi:hypothetical protein
LSYLAESADATLAAAGRVPTGEVPAMVRPTPRLATAEPAIRLMAAKNDETDRRNRPQRIAGRAHWLRWGPILTIQLSYQCWPRRAASETLECLEWQLTDEELAN